jgi:hypothetical protein
VAVLRQDDLKFENNLDYIMKLCLSPAPPSKLINFIVWRSFNLTQKLGRKYRVPPFPIPIHVQP